MAPRGPRYGVIGLAYTPEGQIVPTEGGKFSRRLNEIFQYHENMDVEGFWADMRKTLAPMDAKVDKAIRNGAFKD
jgi:hypothetical protein